MGLLSQPQIDNARRFLTQTGFGTFDNGQFNFSNPAGLNDTGGDYILGAAEKNHYSPEQVAEILGWSDPSKISAAMESRAPQIDVMGDVYATDLARGSTMPTTQPPPTQGGSGYSNGYTPPNEYIGQMQGAMREDAMRDFGRMSNMIRSHSAGVGGLGGSRQGVAEGIGMEGIERGLNSTFGNMNLQGFGQQQDFFLRNRAADNDTLRTGASLYNLGSQADWNPLGNASNIYGQYSGMGSTTNSGSQGGGWMGALGGGLGAAQLGANMGWWGNGGSSSGGPPNPWARGY